MKTFLSIVLGICFFTASYAATDEGEVKFVRIKTDLINVLTVNPRLQLDIRYATSNNFVGIPVYNRAVCYLHKTVAEAVGRVQIELEKQGLGLKIFDGYRPLPVQQLMWDKVLDERYVTNPAKNKGRHTRGTAIDLTLIDLEGKELEMPTEFDDFTEKAFSDCQTISAEAKKNRQLLKEIMEKHGFEQFPFEWWHFDFVGWYNDALYPPLSITLDQLL